MPLLRVSHYELEKMALGTNKMQAPMLSTPPRRERSSCTTRRSCWPTETSGSPKLPPPPVRMRHTDNERADSGKENGAQDLYIVGEQRCLAQHLVSFVNLVWLYKSKTQIQVQKSLLMHANDIVKPGR